VKLVFGVILISLNHLIQNEMQAAVAMFDETMTKALPPQDLEKMWPLLQVQAGEFEEIAASREETQGSFRIVFITCRFKMKSLDAKVVFDKNNKIAGLFFLPTYLIPPYIDTTKFHEEEVSIGEKPWKLPGTLSIPEGKGPFQAGMEHVFHVMNRRVSTAAHRKNMMVSGTKRPMP